MEEELINLLSPGARTMIKNQNFPCLTCRGGTPTGITGHKVGYPTGSKRQFCQTPYSMGLHKNKTPIEKALDKPTSLRLAINAKCYDCVGCGFDPNPSDEIRNCGIVACPLWALRPYQNKKARPDGNQDALNVFSNHHEVKPL